MKNHRSTRSTFNGRRPVTSCSVMVLAALGVLACGTGPGWAQTARPVVPGGTALPANALPVLRGVVSGQAVVNATVAGAAAQLMTIDQSSQRAIIDWSSFNIGSNAEVRFNQPGVTASVLNRIYGLDPTIIQGKLTANGQVLLINQNGILFDRGAQVNVQSLVASTLNISNERYNSGAITTGGLTTPAFAGGYDAAGNTRATRPDGSLPGAILIGLSGNASAGAPQITAASSGSILLFAPRIQNQNGLIVAPDGQVILAAGGKVYLALADGTDPTLRGFQVEIEAAGGSSINLTDFIRNSGVISADRGNVTLAALAISQDGRVSANTAIQANGSVFLAARTIGNAQAGSVSFGAGSVTQVLPDTNDKATLPESQGYADRRGEIRVDARTIASAGTVQAPGGKITLTASEAAGASDTTGARVYLDAGSVTSVAGDWADVPFVDNLLTFKVTSNELNNSPDQKLGVLKGATVTVDLRKGSPLLNLSGYVAAQARTVAEKAATGGELDIRSGGSLIQRAGATLDASGGGYRYGAGTSTTSVLLGTDGKLRDISTATEQQQYTGLLDTFTKTYSRWGQTEVFGGGTYGLGKSEASYLEGKAGGSITLVSAAGLVLDGALKGGVTVGPNQLASAPRGATLKIGAFSVIANDFDGASRVGNVTFAQKATDTLGSGFGAASALTPARIDNVTLAAVQLFGKAGTATDNVYLQNAFDSVEINANGAVRVPEGVHVDGAPGSSLLVRAPQIDVAGSIAMPAGKITLQPVATAAPIGSDPAAANPSVTMRSGGALSTAGVWINNASVDGSFVGDPLPSARQNLALDTSTGTISTTSSSTLNGGTLTIATDAGGTSATLLERGSTLDVGGGAALGSGRKLTTGNGGTLSIANGVSTAPTSDWLQADLSGLSFGNGGQLVLSTPRVVIDTAGANGTLPANTTRLAPSLLSDRGFSNVTVKATQGIAIETGTAINLEQSTRVLDSVAASSVATGGDVRSASMSAPLPDSQRKPVSLTLGVSSASQFPGQATLTMAEGSVIHADPGATISLSAVDALRVDGHIVAPAGNVSLTLKAPVTGAPDLSLGSTAAISVAGTFVPTPTRDGLVQGSVLGAGTITLAATQTGVSLAAGSLLDVSGTTQVLESRAVDGSGAVLRQAFDGNAGALVIRSQGGVVLNSTMRAAAGSAQGAGGAFALELNARDTELTRPAERRIVVTQQATQAASTNLDPAFVDAAISVDALQSAGFQKLRLQSEDRIEFNGDVAMNFQRGIRLDAPLIGLAGDASVSLRAANVQLGQSLDPRHFDGSTYTLDPQGVSPVVAARSGAGLLSVQAGAIDLFGSLTINGVGETRLFADGDLRLTGRNVLPVSPGADNVFGTQIGSLTSSGNLTLNAAQVYPSTRSDFTLSVADQAGGTPVPGGYIVVAGNGNKAGDVYSAGGRLALVADNIVQGGTVKAPLGDIELQAGTRLELSPGSLTSVSANGLVVPFGTTRDGLSWTYQDNLASGTRNLLTTDSADAKHIGLSGATIAVLTGATVDLSGGGDIQASEFVPGSGGTTNVLTQPNTYAIIPKALLTSMPVDTDTATAQDIGFGLQTKKYDTSVYDQLHIGSGASVPAGDYVLLPGRYALLPGAYMVQLQTGSAYSNLQPGATSQLPNGQTVVAGWLGAAGTGIRASGTVGVVVQPGTEATRASDYTLTSSSYFTQLAASSRAPSPRVPIDAGHLVISNTASLDLAGSFTTAPGTGGNAAAPATGRAAEIDISAQRIAVVDKLGDTGIDARYLQLEGGALSGLGGSLLLGGKRSADGNAVRITDQATQVVVANSAAGPLAAPELILAATGGIEVRAGSVLTGSAGSAGTTSTVINVDGDGALLRVSGGVQASVNREMTTGSTGTIQIDRGAVLNAGGSLLLDATNTLQSQGRFAVASGGAVSLASSKVSLGETASVIGIGDGLVLSNSDLTGLASLGTLLIKGYQGIDLYGSAQLGSATTRLLTLDSGAIRGNAVGGAPVAAQISAQEVRLVNTGNAAAADASGAVGSLAIAAQRIVVDAGAQKIGGYASVAMNAASEMVGQGTGSLNVAGDWTISTPKVGVMPGAVQAWQAVDLRDPANPVYAPLTLASAPGTAGASTDAAAGGRLSLTGSSVRVATTVQAHAGSISIAALGDNAADAATLAAGGLLDASGLAKDYNGNIVAANAGQVTLKSTSGTVTLAPGSAIDVRGTSGGAAGSVQIAAQILGLGGTLLGSAPAGGTGGSLTLDANRGDLLDFHALNAALNQGGFDEARTFRLRQGDLQIQAGDVVRGRLLSLSTDTGRIDIAGVLDSRSEQGGAKIEVWAANGLALTGAQVLASGTASAGDAGAALSNGGQVHLAAGGGALSFDAASAIDVSPGAKGRTGSVTFTASRMGNTVAPVQLNGTVLGLRHGKDATGHDTSNGNAVSVTLEAQQSYTVGDGTNNTHVTAGDIGKYASDNAAFIASSDPATLLAGLKGDIAARLHGATELRTAGDLTVDKAWDLTTAQWLANGQAGTLSLRSAGNLTVSSALGMPNDNLLAGDTWNIRLVGGADLAAANPLNTQASSAGQGNVLISTDNGKVRTGTGWIEIAAARDFSMDSLRSVVYTAGKIGASDVANTSTAQYNRWAQDGGSISINAGHDAIGSSNEWITEWMRRPRGTLAADWWAYRPNFQQGLGTLGGGDISVVAGNDVNGLSAMLPTTGRTTLQADGTRTLDVQGGGNLRVLAGNDVIGGSYLVGRGTGRIDAAGSVGGPTPIQLYLMGVSSGEVPEQASVSIAAGGAIALQSVNNPTALQMTASNGTGPSFGAGSNRVATFFSYSANSGVNLMAESGDVVIGSQLLDGRGLGTVRTLTDATSAGAFPASLTATASSGNVALGATRPIVSYPSPTATVALLAQRSLLDPNLTVSDLKPGSATSSANPAFSAASLSGEKLIPTGAQPRIVERAAVTGYAFDFQALTGDVASSGANAAALTVPAATRVRAGRDITNLGLTLQNLSPDDVSQVRADTGDVRTAGIEIRGPGELVVQAGRDVDLGQSEVRAVLGGLAATGNNANPNLPNSNAARLTVVAGVGGNIDTAGFKAAYDALVALNGNADQILAFYRALNGDPDRAAVTSANGVQDLVGRDATYAPYVALVSRYPVVLTAYQNAAKSASLPLGASAEATQANALYALLNKESDAAKIINAKSVADLVQGTQGGAAYAGFEALDAKYPLVFADYRARLSSGAHPAGLTPIIFSQALADITASVVPVAGVTGGSIFTYHSSIQTYGDGAAPDPGCSGQCAGQGDINLWVPRGNVIAGLTTPALGTTIGVVTNGGGAIRSVLSGDFTINQGKVLTAQGGDILIYSSAGSVDAGRGAKTSVSTPPPTRTPITTVVDGETVVVGYQYTLPASASGSGIQTLSSDPDGLGPRSAPRAGSVYLFAPAGTIDAGEAGIRSGGNIVINAQTVLNGSNIAASGSSVGVPVVATGSLASSLATGGAPTTASKTGDDAAGNAAAAARAAVAAGALQKPTILTVEVMGFGDKNCKEKDKDCFAK